jgi:thiamine biosynthesis lipoprotein
MHIYEHKFPMMGCPASFKFYAETPAQAIEIYDLVLKELERLNRTYSNYSSTSFVAKINHTSGDSQGIVVDEETAGLLDYAQQCYEMSDGLFDITSGILHKIWDFHAVTPHLPSQKEIDHTLELVGWDKVKWQRPHLTLPIAGMVLDFGGIVKEYAVDTIVKLCRQQRIKHALIELGGDLAVTGPHVDGRPWKVGVNHPRVPGQSIMIIELAEGAIASSGDSDRYIKIDDTIYPHIINPKTGYPVQGVSAVTVMNPHCLIAGSLTTIGFLKGSQGNDWLLDLKVPFIFIDDQLNVTSTIACTSDKIDTKVLRKTKKGIKK